MATDDESMELVVAYLEGLEHGVTMTKIAYGTGMPYESVVHALGRLCGQARVVLGDDGWFVKASPPPRSETRAC